MIPSNLTKKKYLNNYLKKIKRALYKLNTLAPRFSATKIINLKKVSYTLKTPSTFYLYICSGSFIRDHTSLFINDSI